MTSHQLRTAIEHLEDLAAGGYWIDRQRLARLRRREAKMTGKRRK